MAEKEYIERNELIGNLKYFAPEYYSALIDTLIKNQPAADVEPVRHGQWLPGDDPYTIGVCSVCGCEPMRKPFREALYSYCPNCGAKMKDGDKNG